MDSEKLCSALESILLAADKPVSVTRFKEIFGEEGPEEQMIQETLHALRERLLNSSSGFEIRESMGGFQFCTKSENAEWVRRYFETKPFRLGRSALETLAIIAYRQPVTRAEIDEVRGLDSSHLMRVLIERGLVRMAGKAEVPGRPVQYSTTPKFLEVVGLNSLGELPPLTELEKLQGHAPNPETESLEAGLDRLISDTDQTASRVSGEDKASLLEIDSLIDSAKGGSQEVFESALHQELAEQNQFALQQFQQSSRQWGKMKPKAPETDEGDSIQIPDVLPPEPGMTEVPADTLLN